LSTQTDGSDVVVSTRAGLPLELEYSRSTTRVFETFPFRLLFALPVRRLQSFGFYQIASGYSGSSLISLIINCRLAGCSHLKRCLHSYMYVVHVWV